MEHKSAWSHFTRNTSMVKVSPAMASALKSAEWTVMVSSDTTALKTVTPKCFPCGVTSRTDGEIDVSSIWENR